MHQFSTMLSYQKSISFIALWSTCAVAQSLPSRNGNKEEGRAK